MDGVPDGGVDVVLAASVLEIGACQMARKLDVLDLSRMTGHRDLKSLRRYYNPAAEEIADRLG